jgi:hypothetical protein
LAPEPGWVDLSCGDDGIEGVSGERVAGDFDDLAVVLEQRGAVDEHQRSLELVQPRGRVGWWLPEAGSDEVDFRRSV